MVTLQSGLDRRAALGLIGQVGLMIGATAAGAADRTSDERRSPSEELDNFKKSLAAAPRRRNFKAVPFMVHDENLWDHEAAEIVLSYRYRTRQVWECTELGAPWLNLMREALNGQVFAHSNPGFLAVAALHGNAHLALFEQVAWDAYGLVSLAAKAATKNVFVAAKAGTSPLDDLQNLSGYYGPENSTIAALQERGMVFIACHDSIHAIARNVLHASGGDVATADRVAADLTNHLIPDAVLVPSVVAFLVELQRAGYTYAKGS